MQMISSYGVELRKQNIPIRQTLEIYRSAVSYLTEIYGQTWKELAGIPEAKRRFNAAEHLVHTTKKTGPVLSLISGFRRCLPISGGLRSGTPLEVYRLMKAAWNSGKGQGKKRESPHLCMKTMPCRSFTVMSCTVRVWKEKMKHI